MRSCSVRSFIILASKLWPVSMEQNYPPPINKFKVNIFKVKVKIKISRIQIKAY